MAAGQERGGVGLLSGRVCLLTGSGGTLGSEFCQRYADRYQLAAIWSRRPPLMASQEQHVFDPFDPTAQLAEQRTRVFTIRANVADAAATQRAVDRVLERFGTIDFVVHAAGYRYWAPMFDGSHLLDAFDRHFKVNVWAPLLLTTQVAQSFWLYRSSEENATANRSVVLISSTAGLHAYTGYGQSVYSSSKAALNLLGQHMAGELAGSGVRVNVLAPDSFPGIVETYRVADAIARLVEGDMSGQTLVLDASGETWL